ncbi:hypothetical protein CTEN210_09366 [Chaetoceros tenuissimus]|uniref:Uncharacterized protein n=1 Tax=Chaetoceros tenuissimus TaxID=426638 RepID=A0AAD3CXP5_9STRA|nr:hypothetical protein CTEN210_09366 [Chaetoceros tenuissimus]
MTSESDTLQDQETYLKVGENDAETKKKKLRQIMKLYVMCDKHYRMHFLSSMYFKHKEMWTHTVPLTLITLASGILAFVGSSRDDQCSSVTKILTLIVGSLSIVSVAIQQMGKMFQYATRAKMHNNCAAGMKDLKQNIKFNLIDPENTGTIQSIGAPKRDGSTSNPEDNSTVGSWLKNDEKINEDNRIEKYRELFMQCSSSCTSTIPIQIDAVYALVDARFAIDLQGAVAVKELKRHFTDIHGDNHLLDLRMMAEMNTELFCQIVNTKRVTCFRWCKFWPWSIVDADRAYELALSKVQDMYWSAVHNALHPKNCHCKLCENKRKKGRLEPPPDEESAYVFQTITHEYVPNNPQGDDSVPVHIPMSAMPYN